MALYSYSKTKPSRWKHVMSIFSVILILSGSFLLFIVIYPIVAFELFYSHRYEVLVEPIPNENERLPQTLGKVLGETFTDYTRASLWFPKASPVEMDRTVKSYALSIPKLKINKATVTVGGEDLSKSLVQFTGSMPGTIGNPVIFGHSTLLVFYNPKDYKTIFSKLPDLSNNDQISISVDEVTYSYKVYKMYITTANDLSVLGQSVADEELTLVTCVPPGTYLRRFVVKARLEKI